MQTVKYILIALAGYALAFIWLRLILIKMGKDWKQPAWKAVAATIALLSWIAVIALTIGFIAKKPDEFDKT